MLRTTLGLRAISPLNQRSTAGPSEGPWKCRCMSPPPAPSAPPVPPLIMFFIPALRSVGRTISPGVRALRVLSDPKLLGSDQPPAAAGKDHPPAAAGTVPPPDSAATIIASSQAEL